MPENERQGLIEERTQIDIFLDNQQWMEMPLSGAYPEIGPGLILLYLMKRRKAIIKRLES